MFSYNLHQRRHLVSDTKMPHGYENSTTGCINISFRVRLVYPTHTDYKKTNNFTQLCLLGFLIYFVQAMEFELILPASADESIELNKH